MGMWTLEMKAMSEEYIEERLNECKEWGVKVRSHI